MSPALLSRRALLGFLGLGGLMTVPDFPDEKAPDAHATAISLTGAPPLVLKQVMDFQVGTSIPAGGTLTRPASGQLSLNQPGYELIVNVGQVGGTAAVISVELQWFDSFGTTLIDDELYYFFSGDINGHKIHGRGPTKGDRVVITVKNYSVSSGVSFSYTLLQTSRTFTREFWKTATQHAVQPAYPGLSAAISDVSSNVMCSQSTVLTHGQSLSFVLPLYTGTVRLFGTTTDTTAGNSQWEIASPTDQIAVQPITFEGSNGQSGFAPLGIGSLYAPDIALPRSQCTVQVTNNHATLNQTLAQMIVAQEDRS